MAKKIKQKEIATLRMKDLANGNKSLYLDIYYGGVRKYEFLKLYIIPGSDAMTKRKNANTLALAQEIQMKRINELRDNIAKGRFLPIEKQVSLADYVEMNASTMKKKNTFQVRMSLAWSLKKFYIAEKEGRDSMISEVDRDFILQFQKFCVEQLGNSKGTMVNKMGLFKLILRNAVQDKLIERNPFEDIKDSEKIRGEQKEVDYLTIEEFNHLMTVDIVNPCVKDMFAFSCYTGLRWSDIQDLQWDMIITNNGKKSIVKDMIKTGKQIYIPLSNKALAILDLQSHVDKYVFPRISACWMTCIMKKWNEDSGIKKHIRFHAARHTFATTALTLGADLYTVSSLLGHADISTTQIYAKIVDQKKTDAIDLFDNI